LRKGQTATLNDWGAVCYDDGKFYQAKNRENPKSSTASPRFLRSGLIYASSPGKIAVVVECGAAPRALAMTTPGDT